MPFRKVVARPSFYVETPNDVTFQVTCEFALSGSGGFGDGGFGDEKTTPRPGNQAGARESGEGQWQVFRPWPGNQAETRELGNQKQAGGR